MLNTTKEMEGLYECTAENKADKINSSATLQVFEKPTSQIRPNPHPMLTPGEELTLNCIVNKATLNITWKKDGDPIKASAVIAMILNETTSSLRISMVVEEDSGEYSCVARNKPGILAHSTVMITVKLPPQLNSGLKNRSVTLNSTFTTPCFVKGSPPVSVNWSKDGEALGNNNTLIIKHVTFDDEGFYECVAENLAGKANLSFWMDVTVSPRILLSPVNQSVIDGDPVNFTCSASGVPTPNITWTFSGGKLQLGNNQKNFDRDLFMESFLEMPRTTKEMEGTYKCTAENKANTTSSSATLQVFGKPTAELSPKPYPTLTSGDKLRLICIVNEVTVNITWKKDGDQIKKRANIFTQSDEKKGYLHIAKVVEEDSGVYSCEARNRLGNVARSTVTISKLTLL
ncbi:peroxidasin homolog [Stylophora pistillata]|uniref:peroxidasin homolog n=1 Tax=Stylophora pistillata TaxID=50429 RepID=UPI000C03CB1F|nr:peroxidasin homolog [Stylophora pistillata]